MQENYKILVVDDDMRLRALLERYLTEQGFQVRSVANAEQMDRLLTRESFHLCAGKLPGHQAFQMLPGFRRERFVVVLTFTFVCPPESIASGIVTDDILIFW